MIRLDGRVLAARFGTLAWLTVVWVLLWGDPSPGTIAAGVLVAVGVVVLMPLPRVPVEGRVHPLSTAWLVLTIIGYLVTSSVQVARLCVRPGPGPQSAVLRVPLDLRSDFVLALAVNALNLIPGGIVVRVEPDTRHVHVHVLDAGDERAIRTFTSQITTLQRRFVRAFERPEDWRPSPLHDDAYSSEEGASGQALSEATVATRVREEPGVDRTGSDLYSDPGSDSGSGSDPDSHSGSDPDSDHASDERPDHRASGEEPR